MPDQKTPSSSSRHAHALALVLASVLMASCGGGDGADGSAPSVTAPDSIAAPVLEPPVSGAASDAESTCALPDFAAEVLRQINTARTASRTCGTRVLAATVALSWNGQLFNAAQGHSADMATHQYFSHTSLDGRTLGQRVTASGYVWRSVGENIAAGQRDVTTVMNGWLASAGHCENIMNSEFRDVGVACVLSNKAFVPYWTMVLARP